jgi:hypothetical protein
MGPPIGFIPLRDAADMVGSKIVGPSWRPIREIDAASYGLDKEYPDADGADVIAAGLDPRIERVITMIAEQCEAGEIAAAYSPSGTAPTAWIAVCGSNRRIGAIILPLKQST